MQSILPVDSEQKEDLGYVEGSNPGDRGYLAQSQPQLPQDPILFILMMPLIHLNQMMIQINRMIATAPMALTAPMQSTAPMPFTTPMQSISSGLKITELKRDSSGNIVSIVEKW